jgi:HNH endonuclease
MPISSTIFQQIRERAQFVCEYCGVSENDAGSELTIDHIQPQSTGGLDNLENLAYCCHRCNECKGAYWNIDAPLWNPRTQSRAEHFILLMDGTLFAITPTGQRTITRLRLNRLPLVQHRVRRQQQEDQTRLLVQYRDMVALLTELLEQQAKLEEEQASLLQEYRHLLNILLANPRPDGG